jgi:hypothetical protein
MGEDPSKLISRYVVLNGRAPDFARESDRQHVDLRQACIILSFIGLFENDFSYSRKACQFALALASCEYWRETFMSAHPFSFWQHSAFTEALTVEALAMTIDWAGEALNSNGKNFLVSKIYEKGLNQITKQFYKNDYYLKVNPAIVFFPPLILGAIILSESWPNYRRQLRLFMQFFRTAYANAILADGGTRLSPGYWNKKAIPAVSLYLIIGNYIRTRSADLTKRLKKRLLRKVPFLGSPLAKPTASILNTLISKYIAVRMFPGYTRIPKKIDHYRNYLESVTYSDKNHLAVFPVGDSTTSSILPEGIFMLARLKNLKDQPYWQARAQKLLTGNLKEISQSTLASIHAILSESAPPGTSADHVGYDKVAQLPESCLLSVQRSRKDIKTCLLFVGLPSNANHRHKEVGSFSLIVNDHDVLIDRGSLSYSHPLCQYLKAAAYHNTATPLLPNGRWAEPQNGLRKNATIRLKRGENGKFRSWIDLSEFWQAYFKNYHRSLSSRDIHQYTITDVLKTQQPTAVAFHLHTPYKCTVKEKSVCISVDNFQVVVKPAKGYTNTSCFEDLIDYRNRPVNHIVFETTIRKDHNLMVEIDIEQKR